MRGELKYRTPDNVLHPATGVDSFGPFKEKSQFKSRFHGYHNNMYKKQMNAQNPFDQSLFGQECDVGFGGKDGLETYKTVDFDL